MNDECMLQGRESQRQSTQKAKFKISYWICSDSDSNLPTTRIYLINFNPMPKISNLTLVTPTLLDRNPILDDADNLTKAQNNQGLRDLLVQNIFTPQGHLLNGRILPSVTNFNLTLALKTYAGTDPSATDFVIANIGGTLRKISSALSVTLALGTNWMNLGSAELATIETDLFAYLGYNATDGITIGYSRIPGAKVYSDFSITTTNEKYLAVSNRTTASANDPYEVIGRFSAILSLTPFNWSVPTFTALNLIQKPVYDTRWMDWNAQFTAGGSMTIASLVKAGAKYKITNDTLAFNSKHSMTLG